MQRRDGLIGGALALTVGAAMLLPTAAFAQSDLSIDKTDSADPATVGSQFTYSIAVSNDGPEAATGVTLEDTLPNEVDFVSATPSQGACDNKGAKKIECALGTIAATANATVAIVVDAKRAGTAINTAVVSGAGPADPTPANNTDSEQTVIQEPASTTPTCGGEPATVVGTTGSDTLTGTEKRDVIVSLAGDDVVTGLGGKDLICTAAGNDIIRGGDDDDQLRAGTGNDRLLGGDGNDLLAGGGGSDKLSGAAGDDVLGGGSGADSCNGGPGADTERSC